MMQLNPNGFFPSNLTGWLQVLSLFAAAVGAAVGFAWRAVRSEVRKEWRARVDADNGIGSRIDEINARVGKGEGLLDAAALFQDRSINDRLGIHDRLGQVEGRQSSLAEEFHQCELKRVHEMGELRTSLARIEEKIDGLTHRNNRRDV